MTSTLAVGRVLTIEDPADGSVVVEVPVAGEQEVVAAVAAARAAFPGWARTAPVERAAAVARAADAVAARADELARLTTREMGRPLADARADIEKKLLQQEAQSLQQKWLASLRSKAFIKTF